MADIFNFDINGIDLILGRLEVVEKEMDQRVDDALLKLAQKVIEDAKKLAPLDEGDLEAALVIGEVKRELFRRFIEVGTSPEVDEYAIVQHEGFRKTKKGKIVHMSPGPKTQSKPPHKGYMPGKKFLENAISINERLILTELKKALQF